MGAAPGPRLSVSAARAVGVVWSSAVIGAALRPLSPTARRWRRACSRLRSRPAAGRRRPTAGLRTMSHDEQTHTSGRLEVTIDARALDGTRMGTQVHVLELVRALARTAAAAPARAGARREDRSSNARRCCASCRTPRSSTPGRSWRARPQSAVFHRPVQTFSHEDVALACDLGERIVLSQLDLIAYDNPSYFPDARAFEDYRRASRHGMSAAERVVVFSEHTRARLLAEDLVEDERIRIVPPGLDHDSSGRAAQAGRAASSAWRATSCSAWAPTTRTRTGCSRCELLAELRARHDWHGRARVRGRPRRARLLAARPSASCWTLTRSCARASATWGRSMRPRRRG